MKNQTFTEAKKFIDKHALKQDYLMWSKQGNTVVFYMKRKPSFAQAFANFVQKHILPIFKK